MASKRTRSCLIRKASFCIVLCAGATVVVGEDLAQLKPLMTRPAKEILKDDFEETHALKKGVWQSRQGTRWAIKGGVLRGQQSSPEYQAKKKDHFGYEPRLSIPATPNEFIARFSFRFIEGKQTAIVPFIEFGHHVCRVHFSQRGTWLLSNGETMKLAESKDFVWKSGKWYHALAEMKGDEFVFQIADGPTLYARRESFAKPPASGGKGFGIAGPRKGFVEIDNLSIRQISADEQTGWKKRRSEFPKFTPIQVKEPKKKKPKA